MACAFGGSRACALQCLLGRRRPVDARHRWWCFRKARAFWGAAAVVLLSFVVLLKVIASVLPVIAIRADRTSPIRRVIRSLAWADAFVLTGYGLVYTVVGLLVQAGFVTASPDADHYAMAWHTYLWDPWFLVWGLLVTAALLNSRASADRETRSPDRRASSVPGA